MRLFFISFLTIGGFFLSHHVKADVIFYDGAARRPGSKEIAHDDVWIALTEPKD